MANELLLYDKGNPKIPRRKRPSSTDDEFETPWELFNQTEKKFNLTFGIDAFATKENAKCKVCFTREDNSFEQDWVLKLRDNKIKIVPIFINHPHTMHEESIEKCDQQFKRFNMPLVMLLPNNCQRTKYYFELIEQNRFTFENQEGFIHVYPIPGSITFLKNGKPTKDSSRNAYSWIYWKPRFC